MKTIKYAFLITLLLGPFSHAEDQIQYLSHHHLAKLVTRYLNDKKIPVEQLTIRRPFHPVALAVNTINTLIETKGESSLYESEILRTAVFKSGSKEYSCIVEARALSEKIGGGVEVGLFYCSPSKLPNGADAGGLLVSNMVMNRRTYPPNEVINESQEKLVQTGQSTTPPELNKNAAVAPH